MASIDKTYTDSYKEYKEFKDWANNQIVTFFDGHTERIGSCVWEYEESDFANGEVPIMNTPTWVDVYLIQHCTSKFVLDRMKSVYGDKFDVYKSIQFPSLPPDGYKQNRKITIKNSARTRFTQHNSPYGKCKNWWVQSNMVGLWYNEETDRWIEHGKELYPANTNTAQFPTVKSIVRHLRKQYLPSGIKFTISGGIYR